MSDSDAQTDTAPSEILPFNQPEAVAAFLGRTFLCYMTYADSSFLFDWLEKTPDIRLRCRNTTEQETLFTTPPELLRAIHTCEWVTSPEKDLGLPSDWGFAGLIQFAVHKVQETVDVKSQRLYGPSFKQLYCERVRNIHGLEVLCPHQNHWTFVIQDHTCARDMRQKADCRNYMLKSEIMAATSIFFRQMNEMVWSSEKNRYTSKPRYKGGLLTATVVTFTRGKVRVVQATIRPSEKHPTLDLNLRAKYTLTKAGYDKNVAFDVLKWILDPPQAELETEP
ncbi:hypothetical protein TEQG_00075 [Trichophyton equinum CBS 127.97]|uniref:Fungal-type protein kinase domain-containing protein n=1 Tax=Trichophyton equinum (strain ATCC MYA-4606 / CBS 127.97) TaxID=559882 RepID=F2PGK3_TRIEC|nr:hypothetical protein TEQG_00075 [Trichophyton equinum CBS 127.97]